VTATILRVWDMVNIERRRRRRRIYNTVHNLNWSWTCERVKNKPSQTSPHSQAAVR
jgi:hypothetical protein